MRAGIKGARCVPVRAGLSLHGGGKARRTHQPTIHARVSLHEGDKRCPAVFLLMPGDSLHREEIKCTCLTPARVRDSLYGGEEEDESLPVLVRLRTFCMGRRYSILGRPSLSGIPCTGRGDRVPNRPAGNPKAARKAAKTARPAELPGGRKGIAGLRSASGRAVFVQTVPVRTVPVQAVPVQTASVQTVSVQTSTEPTPVRILTCAGASDPPCSITVKPAFSRPFSVMEPSPCTEKA